MRVLTPQLETLPSPSLACGEGPVWDARTRSVSWTDSGGTSIHRLVEDAPQSQRVHEGLHAASLVSHRNGGFVTCGAHGFSRLMSEGRVTHYAHPASGPAPIKLNDIKADPQGRVYAGQESFQDGAPYTPGHLFRLDPDGRHTVVDEGLHLSNGMAFDPASSRFYLADTIQRKIFHYRHSAVDGSLSEKRTLIEIDREHGLPDGLCFDAEGFLWVAMFLGGRLLRIDPDGQIERVIRLPFAQPTSVAFGGANLDWLYVTSASVQWETALAPEGHDFASPRGGQLYRIRPEVAGRNVYLANV